MAKGCKVVSFQCGMFKTYAEPSRVFELGDSTAVLGPNGSGKSNLMDSVCFALGLSSNQIRGEEGLSQLVNGTIVHEAEKEIAKLIF